jgi:hypothetical protein
VAKPQNGLQNGFLISFLEAVDAARDRFNN